MKKFLVTLLVFLLTVCCLFMTACSVNGNYKLEKISGEIVPGKEYLGQTITEDFITLTLNEDGTGEINLMGIQGEITWVELSDVIKVTVGDKTYNFNKYGDKLTFIVQGITFVLKR